MNKSFWALLLMITVFSCSNTSSQNSNSSLTNWAIQNAQKIESFTLLNNQDDINSLKQIVGDAEVVCLGESRHDIHEQFLLKHRFIKYLVEEMGFTTFVLEASLPYSSRINEYVLHGTGDIEEIMVGMPGWFLWDTEEILDVINWIRAHNQDPENSDKVRFYGIDIVAPNDGLDQIFSYLQKVDRPFWEEIQDSYFARDIIDDNYWPNTRQQYAELTAEKKQTLRENHSRLIQKIKDSKDSYITLSSESAYDWISILTYSVHEMNEMFSDGDQLNVGLIRDNAMAEIALWIKQRNDKVIIWAHNVHIAKAEFSMSMLPGIRIKGMGYLLNQELKEKMVSIGASFNKGEFQGENRTFEPALPTTIDGVLASLHMPYFLLDINAKTSDSRVKKWLTTENTMRGQEFEMSCVPEEAFDAIYFVDNVSKVIYNPATLERLRN